MAPCHFLSEPWRFYTAGPETKAKLCALNEEKKAMFEGVPEWLIVTMCSEHEEGSKLYYEDHAAVSCPHRILCYPSQAKVLGPSG